MSRMRQRDTPRYRRSVPVTYDRRNVPVKKVVVDNKKIC